MPTHTQMLLPFHRSAAPRRAAAAAIRRAEGGAGEAWLHMAIEAIEKVAKIQAELTTDDVWEHIGAAPPDPRALGGAMRRAKKEGLIEPTDMVRSSERTINHGRPLRVWRSLLVFKEEHGSDT